MSSVAARTRLRALGTGRSRPVAHQSLLLGVCCMAQFMVILDVSIVNVALPSIQDSLGFADSDLQWVVNAYTITFAGFLMLSGRAADLLGGRRTFATGLLVFSLASLVGGTAADQGILIGARALQGLGGAVMAASSLAIITYSFAAGPERHRAIGLWGAMNGAGGAAGTLLGGIITQELSWRWVLLINLPIGIAAALVARAVIPEGRREGAAEGFDLGGALAVTVGLLSLVYGIVNAGPHGWGSAQTLVPIGVGVALLALFVFIEAHAEAPLVPLRVFSNRLLRTSNIVVLLFSAALFPMWYFCSLYLQKVLHYGPLDAGLAFLPMALTLMAIATQAGGLVARFGAGRVLCTGLVLMSVGLALFARISADGTYVSDFLLPGLLTSVGIGLSIVPSTIAATATAAPGEAGLASGLVNTSRQMGGALGLAILASVAVLFTNHLINSRYQVPPVAVTNGFRLAFLCSAVFTATGAVLAFRFIPSSMRPPLAPVPPGPAPAARGGTAPAAMAAAEAPPPSPASQQPSGLAAAAAEAPPPAAPPERSTAAPGAANAVAPSGREEPVHPQAAPGPERAVEPVGGPAPGRAVIPDRAAPAVRRPLASVGYTLAGGGSWAPAPGTMTLSFARRAGGPA